VKVKSIK